MTPKQEVLRASAKDRRGEIPTISTVSCNGCDIKLPNQIQEDCWWESATAKAAIATRFWTKVNKTDGCWLWTASATGGRGMQHGQFAMPRRKASPQPHIYAHRCSWILAYGAIPDGLQVCHKCDVPRCVRPEHLFLGTQADNLKDCARKGRFHTPRTNKLSQADRLAIYHMPARRGICVELAIRYGVTKTCISLTRRGRFIGSPLHRAGTPVPIRHAVGR